MRSAGGPAIAIKATLTALLMASAWWPLHAKACSTIPPMRSPPVAELVQTSDLIAIVHIDRIQPLSVEEVAFTDRVFSDPPLNVPIRLPTRSAEFTAVRALKGKIPQGIAMDSGITSCDVVLMEGRDYLVFARTPDEPGDRIQPRYGTFMIDQSPQSLDALAEVELSLSSSNPTPP